LGKGVTGVGSNDREVNRLVRSEGPVTVVGAMSTTGYNHAEQP
jgi:hypothetical protein